MIHRLSGALIWTVVLVLIVLPMAGCSRRDARSTASSPPAVPSSVPPAVSSSVVPSAVSPAAAGDTLARTEPAVWAAVRFEQVRCAWDWRRPLHAYVAAQQALATPAYGARLAAAADPVSWRHEVVAGRQRVTCTVSAAHRVIGAPSTSTTAYVRMSVTEQVTSKMGSFDAGDGVASWVVQRVDGRWLVAGTFDGG